ncbi:MAG: methytransferase partner Trm112 [Halobacteriales archaeon]
MKEDLMEILCCPVCKGELELDATREEDGEIVEGTLYCDECDETYEIDDGIPDLLPPEAR